MKKSLGIIFALVTLFAVVPNALALTKAFQVNTLSGGTLTTGLISYWNMQGNSNDYYGSNNGTDTSVSYGTSYGKVAQGGDYGGSSYTTISAASSINFLYTQPFSVSFWIYIPSLPGATTMIMDKQNGISGEWSWYFNLDSSNKMNFTVSVDQLTAGSAIWATALSANNWYNVIGTWNGSSIVSIAVNNGTPVTTSYSPSSPTQSAGNLYFSQYYTALYRLTGYLDEVGIWSKVLSTQEITDLYNGGAGQTMCNGTGGPLCSTPRRHQIVLNPFEAKFEHFQFA